MLQVKIDVNQKELIKIEEICSKKGITISKYFTDLHLASLEEIDQKEEPEQEAKKPRKRKELA